MINKNFAELDAEGTKKIFYDSAGLPSIFIGIQNDGSSAIRVSKPGVDVTTATNSQLAFNSSQVAFKIAVRGTINWVATSAMTNGIYTKVIPHGLGYVPSAMVYFGDSGSNYWPLPFSNPGVSGGNIVNNEYYSYVVDATNLTIRVILSSSVIYGIGNTLIFTYYLLQESAN